MKIWMLNRKRKVFVSTWKTDNTSAGSSTDHQVKLPLEASGTYDFHVDWGDGNKDHITAWDQAEVTHPYSSIGTYPIKITGVCKGFVFNNGGDKLKLLNISNWGNLELGNSGVYFYGCSNLTITALNKLRNPTMTDGQQFLRDCSSYNNNVDWLDSSNIQDFKIMFYGCSLFNSSVSNLNTAKGTGMHYMFRNCYVFNQSVANFNTANVANMAFMFYGCNAFNQSVANFNTAKVITLESMFEGCNVFNQSVANFNTALVANMQKTFAYCPNFNQDISSWNFEAVTNMINMFAGSISWSTENYDKFLISAAGQDVKTGVQFDCVTKYTAGGAAEAARTYLTGTKSWTINDLWAA
jgi:surface protein